MEIDLNSRINALEEKLVELSNLKDPNQRLFCEIYSQISIIDSLIHFYSIEETEKFKNLKMAYYKHSNDYYIYNTITKHERIEKISQEIDHIHNMNSYLNDFVQIQNQSIDNLGLFMNDADQSLIQSNAQLAKYQSYLDKKYRLYRAILLILLIIILLIFVKVYKFLF